MRSVVEGAAAPRLFLVQAMTDLTTSYAHCEAQFRNEDHDGWLAALFAPAEARPGLHAIGAFALEVGHVRERVRQPIAGEIRLQWWQDVVDRSRASEAAAHPVAAALLDTMARAELSPAVITDMIDAYRSALYDEPPADVAALERRLVLVRGIPIRLNAQVLGATGDAVEAAAADAGVALGIMDLFSALPRAAGRHPAMLPSDLLSRHGATQGEIDVGRVTPGVELALADLRAAARSRMMALRARRKRLGAAGPAVLTASLVEPRLRRAERRDPFGMEADLPAWRRQWILWRAARRGGVL